METYYTIDADNRLLEVGGPWDAFALENGGEQAVANKVTGHEIWNFVDGFETQSYLNTLFFFCRRGSTQFETTYRCDSPVERRLVRMKIEPRDDDVLLVRHRLVSSTRFTNSDKVATIQDMLGKTRCSTCCRFMIKDTWIDPFAVLDVKNFPISHTFCPDCKATAREQLETVSSEIALKPRENTKL